MRKYLAATVLGAMLMAGQAAAYDSAVVNLGDRIGSQSASSEDIEGVPTIWLVLAGAAVIGLIAWGVSSGGNGHSSTP